MADGVVRTLPFSPSRTHPRTLSLTRSLTLSPSLSHTHTLSLSLSLSLSLTHSLTHTLTLFLAGFASVYLAHTKVVQGSFPVES